MQRIQTIFITLLATLLIAQAIFSLQWQIAHDEAPLLYEAFLMQNGSVPYKDFFDFQMPGSYILYYLLGTLSNFGPMRLRLLDLLILTTIIIVTYFALQKINKTSAIITGILFGLKYLQAGPTLSLQREYLILIFLSLAIFISLQDSLTNKQRLILGLLFGLASTVKPHSAIGLIPIILFDHNSSWLKKIIHYAIGFITPILCIVIWLASTNALTPFLDIALNYWNLYGQINGELEITSGTDRLSYILNLIWQLGGHGLWLIPATFAVYLNQNKKIYLLASLVLCYAIYPAFTGQFFAYHYIPFLYCIILLASLSITSQKSKVKSLQSPVSNLQFSNSQITTLSSFLFLLVILFSVKPSQAFIRQIENKPIAVSSDRAIEIANFLEKNLEAGDIVQPLDWTGGTLLAMLQTQTPIATNYVFDFYFYHHISNPYIQNLRNDFMNQLEQSKPRFIIEVTSPDKPWVGGDDTTRTKFPELQNFLNDHYSITIQKDDYIIYEIDDRP